MSVRTRRRDSYPTALAKSLKLIILLSGKLRGSANHAWQEGTSSLRLQTVNPTDAKRIVLAVLMVCADWRAPLYVFATTACWDFYPFGILCQCRNVSFQAKTGDENGYSLGNTGSQNQMQGISSRYGRSSAFVHDVRRFRCF